MDLEDFDAKHLMVAICNGYDRFLTTDPDFLGARSQIESAFPIKVLKPSELVAELASVTVRPLRLGRLLSSANLNRYTR